MTKFRFTPEMFEGQTFEEILYWRQIADRMAERANAHLDAEREKMPVVYGLKGVRIVTWQEDKYQGCEYRARLWDIEKLKDAD
jgi:hypothetical protein